MFEAQTKVKYEYTRWWSEGLAEHLGNKVYPHTNFEWGPSPVNRLRLDFLAEDELTTCLFDRSYSNFLFFQYFENKNGEKSFIDLVTSLPNFGGRVKQQQALANYPDMTKFFHEFAKAMTDQTIMDSSNVPVPYKLTEDNCPTITLTETGILEDEFIDEPFSVSRLCLEVADDKRAQLEFLPEGQLRRSARPGSVADWSEVPTSLPVKDCEPEIIMVVTTTDRNTGFALDVPEVKDEKHICTILGEWVVDNDSLNVKQTAFAVKKVGGEIHATFNADGTVDVVYDDWSFVAFDWDTNLDIGGVDCMNYEEFTFVTEATGTTTYKVDGDRIDFGASVESSYLKGTETVYHIKDWTPNPPEGCLPDFEGVYENSAKGRNVFAGSPQFELGSQLKLIFYNNEVLLNRVSSAAE